MGVKALKYFCLSFDLEEFDLPKEFGINLEEEQIYRESFKGAKKVLKLLEELSLKATFFVTAEFALKFPSLIKEISKKHEIALHGYKHDSDYSSMPGSEAFEELSKAKKEIEKIISKRVYGFRAPRMMPPSFKVLKGLGIEYDSSLHPTYVPGRYNYFFANRKIAVKEGIVQIPISVTPLLKFPFTWLWFRNFGLSYAKICTKLAMFNNRVINIYFHPWEFQDLKEYDIPFFIKKNTGARLNNQLKTYLIWCKKKGFIFTTFKDFIHLNGILVDK